ncbi:type II secretion system protein [Geminisphaera colitermitum]|uniref:type II secretion system protein n=1 Tax=Geminisphaera colitermitum TaxID=1148786 RepID=UPI000196507E|nr:type II secretion system protein [Geminisphaera colitermitum]
MKTRAFTLIELLTVIAIIGVLAAIIIPTIASVRNTARNVQCISNLRQIAQGAQLWVADNRGRMPDAKIWGAADNSNPYSIRPYLAVTGAKTATTVFTCPESFRLHPDPYNGLTENLRTYSINEYACGSLNENNNHSDLAGNAKLINQVRNPSKTSLFMDGNLETEGGQVYTYLHVDRARSIWQDENGKRLGLLAVHKGKLNVAFIDGHVENRHLSTIPTRDNAEGSYDYNKAKKHPFWGTNQ